MTPQILDKPTSETLQESCVTLRGVSWERFKSLEADLDGLDGVKLYYLSGEVEIVSPISEEHEEVKATLGMLLEVYMRETGIRFYGRGGFTLEEKGASSGTPDESYSIGSKKSIPDIVIEVIVTSGTLNKREIYKTKKIPEVWFWKKNQLFIYHLREGEYERVSRSEFFPELDPFLLLRYLNHADQYDAVNELIAEIRSMQ